MPVLSSHEPLTASQGRAVEQAMLADNLGEGAVPVRVEVCQLGMGQQPPFTETVANLRDFSNAASASRHGYRPETGDEFQ